MARSSYADAERYAIVNRLAQRDAYAERVRLYEPHDPLHDSDADGQRHAVATRTQTQNAQ